MLNFFRRFILPNFKPPADKKIIWVHTPSVGEFLTAKPLLQKLKNNKTYLVLTYFSPRAENFLKKQDLADFVLALPFPFGGFIGKFNKLINPELFLLIESDRFPELLKVKAKQKFILNARISESSFKLLRLLKPIYQTAFGSFNKIICKSEEDYNKFLTLGVKEEKLTVCGNLKAVLKPPAVKIDIEFPRGVKVITAGSTHKGEEKLILNAFSEVKKVYKNAILILAPRHIERIPEVKNLLASFPFSYSLRTEVKNKTFEGDVLVVDTLGELSAFYEISDLCIVGGTFIPLGGHNILEPAYFGKPVIYGPHIWKFKDLEELLKDIGLGFRTEGVNLAQVLLQWLENPPKPKKDLKKISEQILDCYLRYTVDNPTAG